MKAVFIGCVSFSYALLERLLELDGIDIAGVVTRESSDFNADFRSLEPLAQKAGVPCLNVSGNDHEMMTTWIRDLEPDVIFCFGWSYLLGRDILDIPPEGVIGYHPALLPRNRGRHPIIWALALGLKETGSTFFIMDEGADSGDIVSQRRVAIGGEDDAQALYDKLLYTAKSQLDDLFSELLKGNLERTPQDPSRATTWRKRGKRDGEIDWRMTAQGICNLVRALSSPYVGAHCLCNGADLKVWKAVPAAAAADMEPGRVLAIEGTAITVKCGDGAVTLVEHEFQDLPAVGDSL